MVIWTAIYLLMLNGYIKLEYGPTMILIDCCLLKYGPTMILIDSFLLQYGPTMILIDSFY